MRLVGKQHNTIEESLTCEAIAFNEYVSGDFRTWVCVRQLICLRICLREWRFLSMCQAIILNEYVSGNCTLPECVLGNWYVSGNWCYLRICRAIVERSTTIRDEGNMTGSFMRVERTASRNSSGASSVASSSTAAKRAIPWTKTWHHDNRSQQLQLS